MWVWVCVGVVRVCVCVLGARGDATLRYTALHCATPTHGPPLAHTGSTTTGTTARTNHRNGAPFCCCENAAGGYFPDVVIHACAVEFCRPYNVSSVHHHHRAAFPSGFVGSCSRELSLLPPEPLPILRHASLNESPNAWHRRRPRATLTASIFPIRCRVGLLTPCHCLCFRLPFPPSPSMSCPVLYRAGPASLPFGCRFEKSKKTPPKERISISISTGGVHPHSGTDSKPPTGPRDPMATRDARLPGTLKPPGRINPSTGWKGTPERFC